MFFFFISSFGKYQFCCQLITSNADMNLTGHVGVLLYSCNWPGQDWSRQQQPHHWSSQVNRFWTQLSPKYLTDADFLCRPLLPYRRGSSFEYKSHAHSTYHSIFKKAIQEVGSDPRVNQKDVMLWQVCVLWVFRVSMTLYARYLGPLLLYAHARVVCQCTRVFLLVRIGFPDIWAVAWRRRNGSLWGVRERFNVGLIVQRGYIFII